MKNLGKYYGAAVLNEAGINDVVLEYYKSKKYTFRKAKLKTYYGITIVKREYKKDKVNLEKNTVKQISTNENKIKNLLEVLKTYKVTPIALNDVLTDLLKMPKFQEN